MTDETKILGRCEFMKYNNDELKIINEWLTSLAVQHLVDEDFFLNIRMDSYLSLQKQKKVVY
jgi:hypothetical protein